MRRHQLLQSKIYYKLKLLLKCVFLRYPFFSTSPTLVLCRDSITIWIYIISMTIIRWWIICICHARAYWSYSTIIWCITLYSFHFASFQHQAALESCNWLPSHLGRNIISGCTSTLCVNSLIHCFISIPHILEIKLYYLTCYTRFSSLRISSILCLSTTITFITR